MNAKAIGVVSARGLGLLFALNGFSQIVTLGFSLLSARPRSMPPGSTVLWAVPIAYFLAAWFLWKNAGEFADLAKATDAPEPITEQGFLKTVLVCICAYYAFGTLGSAVRYVVDKLSPPTPDPAGAIVFPRNYSLADLVVFMATLITIFIICKGRAIVTYLHYPQSDPESEQPLA